MKYIVILGDGMSDYEDNAKQTPLSLAKKPTIDMLSSKGEVGLVSTIPDGMSAGSDTANLSVLGYDPKKYYTGRSPLEAVALGIDMKTDDVSYRCNLVTLSEEKNYSDKTMIDYSADEISTEEAAVLIKHLAMHLNTDTLKFYSGISYRHCIIKNHATVGNKLIPPHDISDKVIGQYLPSGIYGQQLMKLMIESYSLLDNHPVNIERAKKGKRKANSIWIWGEGTRPRLDSFKQKYGLNAGMISAVDLLKGIGICAGMKNIEVKGATGNIHTNFEGKADAAIDALKDLDFIYLHIEAPDECGHRGEKENKIKAIEYIDQKVVKRITQALDKNSIDYRMLICPDHATPCSLKTHVKDPIPFLIFDSTANKNCGLSYTENNAKKSELHFENGEQLMNYFVKRK